MYLTVDIVTSYRPIAGYLNFCPGTLFSDPSVFQPLLTAAMHELLTMLVRIPTLTVQQTIIIMCPGILQ